MKRTAFLTLPFPPSINAYWRSSSRGSYISAAGKKYKVDAGSMLREYSIRPIEGEVEVVLDFYRPRKSGDLDNRIKQVLDALQGHAYENDSQVVMITARRFDRKHDPRVEIQVREAGSQAMCHEQTP